MSNQDSDPLGLFTPEKDKTADEPRVVDPSTPSKPAKPSRRTFVIVPPTLASAEKKQYKARAESSLAHSPEIANLDEVIGEYRDKSGLWYYARYKKGIAYSFPAEPFKRRYQPLLKEYEERKKAGTLAPFDPSAPYVHPKSRVRTLVSINHNRATVKTKPLALQRDSEDDAGSDEEESDDESDEYEVDEDEAPVRRSTRPKKAVKKLPYSPKKTRSQLVFTIHDSDSEEQSEVEQRPTRRSARRVVKLNLDAQNYKDASEESEESDASSATGRASKLASKPRPKINRGRAARPAYGHVRMVADLDYDPFSDEETQPLREHRSICEKCHREPAHTLINEFMEKKKRKPKKKKKSEDDFEESADDEEKLAGLGGWIRCLKCPVSAHWKCLASNQRDEILKAARERDRAEWRSKQPHSKLYDEDGKPKATPGEPGKRAGIDAYQCTEFICGSCMKGGICMGCTETALEPDNGAPGKAGEAKLASATAQTGKGSDVEMRDGTKPDNTLNGISKELLFRCFTCKRLAHYCHLPVPDGVDLDSVPERAEYYQQDNSWLCADCSSYTGNELDVIIAWRPYPAKATEPPRPADEPPHYKTALPREYLVKWEGQSFRRLAWVPHMWLASTNPLKLKHFLTSGTRVDLLPKPVEDDVMDVDASDSVDAPTFEIGADESRASSEKPGVGSSRASSVKARDRAAPSLTDAAPDAERRVPLAWKTIDRIMDLLLWRPEKRKSKKHKKARKGKAKSRVESDDSDDDDAAIQAEYDDAFGRGEQPSSDLTETIEEWEARTKQTFSLDEIDSVVWAFIKWDDLGYDQSTWDSPPRAQEPGYAAFQDALARYIFARSVQVPKQANSEWETREKDDFMIEHRLRKAEDLNLGQKPGLQLMDFQVDGFNWLNNNWWNRQNSILADDMGLGKTVQIATFLGNIKAKFDAFPALVVVPNSTITNWTREFEKWAPNLRVVPFYGEAKAREIIKDYELTHTKHPNKYIGIKYHVLVTTYEALVNPKDFSAVFKNVPRWEVLVVDEGQRLKSGDGSLLFKKLNELRSKHRVIMTGTPLNNNIRELFNLMNFLDPQEWHDLEALEKEHEELTQELIDQLHARLRPYFLRRIKSQVLKLPPKNEVIVPVSMTPLQKEVYKSILSHNSDILKGLTQPTQMNGRAAKGKINNVLMQLRKCLQHPYLYDADIEPEGLSGSELHMKLIDASAKLRLLKTMLPKLKARGHRVLLFSQFVINLNIIEDFLNGEGIKYLRLDGNSKGADRQKGMDEFNRPGSDIFIYLLSTRAGENGINLFTADTVIIYDPDFNPHQDLQAIARAYRYGQQNKCLVFKFMVKDSAEERIIQIGKKKLVLDHLIVQKMDDEDSGGDDVQSILTYGAKTLFESEADAKDITYLDQDVEKLIEKTETEAPEEEAGKGDGLSFAFAKVWAADKDSMEDVGDEDPSAAADAWAQTLQKINEEVEKQKARQVASFGRGVRRAAAAKAQQANNTYLLDSPANVKGKNKKPKIKSKSTVSSDDGSAYGGSAIESDGSATDDTVGHPESPPLHHKENLYPHDTSGFLQDGSLAQNKQHGRAPLNQIRQSDTRNPQYMCDLCATRHGEREGDCPMTEKSEYLAEYRKMLLTHAGDEPDERRLAAINAIDATLQRRNQSHLVEGQPLFVVSKKRGPIAAPQMMGIPASTAAAPASTATSQQLSQAPSAPHALPSTSQPRSASGSKRASSRGPDDEPMRKKAKGSGAVDGYCVVCTATPSHLLKDCPVVKAGSESVAKAIMRLENNPIYNDAVNVLRKIFKHQRKRERPEISLT